MKALFNVIKIYRQGVFYNSPQFNAFHLRPSITFIRRLKSSTNMNAHANTAGIVIIGDEITKGRVHDCNSFYLCQRLHNLGVTVKAVIAIPDDSATIAKYVSEFSSSFSYVFTAGGIGPTHDDITYEAIAGAFNDQLRIDSEIEKVYKSHLKQRYTEAHRKLATIPCTGSLVHNDAGIPIVNIENVFILPGVPKFLKAGFSAIEKRIGNASLASVSRILHLSVDEISIVTKLNEINEQFSGKVTIGSYPEHSNNYYKVRLILESSDIRNVDECEAALREVLPTGVMIDYDPDPLLEPMKGVKKLMTGELEQPIAECLEICEETLRRYRPEEICIGFNGGKDCSALLHLWYIVVRQHPDYNNNSSILKALYISSGTPFAEVEKFIEESADRYKLNMLRYKGGMKEQLAQLKRDHPSIKAVVMGMRPTDPYGAGMAAFQPTDPDWPAYMRINPLMKFSYSNVWGLIRGLSLPYCPLYDDGYTSLGSIENTTRNKSLEYIDSSGVVRYKPAHSLTLDDLERAGRL